MTLASALLLAYLAITATTTALPSSRLLRPRQGAIPPSTSPTSPLIAPLLADTCTDIFGTSGLNSFTRNLFVAGDGWLQGFVSPITGSLCSLSFAAKALQLNPSNATVAVYALDVTKDQIVAGGVKPVTTATTSTTDERLIFTFCGNASMFLTEDLTYNFAITFAAASFPNVPLTLAFQTAVNSTGSFFGPSFTPIFTVVNEGIVFNLTTSAVPVSCGGAQVSSSLSSSVVETSTTAVIVPETTTTVAAETTTTAAVETTTTAVESTIPIIETTTTAETTPTVETSTTAVATTIIESSTTEPVTTTTTTTTTTTETVETTATPTTATSTAEFTIVSTISFLTSTLTAEPGSTIIAVSTSTVGPATLPTVPATTTTTTTATSTATAVPTTCIAPLCESCRATAWSSCPTAKAYTTCINSPTLKLCYRLACAPHQEERDAYLKQCEQLEIWARYTHDDEIPDKW
ncbi:hypothetical protein HDU87_001355 [Geranomyces variabilis]|uniref:Uncharacterized protein n=1 Tax=Geranomyces variabilis TaxID=109894 RepID=A0AAD5TPX2_9FUNG|nr:hypothetical protein HDU87_001355 [Geranomyces variabilis]